MAEFTPPDPHFRERIRDSFNRQPFMRVLGAELRAVEPGSCDVAVMVRPELTQQVGYLHGAVIAGLADDAAGYAAYTLMPASSTVVTVEYKLNYLSPITRGTVSARALVIKAGRQIFVCRVEVVSVAGGREVLAAIALMTMMQMSGRSDRRQVGSVGSSENPQA